MWCLKCLVWSNSLPLYQEAFLRSAVAEEVQVFILNDNAPKLIRGTFSLDFEVVTIVVKAGCREKWPLLFEGLNDSKKRKLASEEDLDP